MRLPRVLRVPRSLTVKRDQGMYGRARLISTSQESVRSSAGTARTVSLNAADHAGAARKASLELVALAAGEARRTGQKERASVGAGAADMLSFACAAQQQDSDTLNLSPDDGGRDALSQASSGLEVRAGSLGEPLDLMGQNPRVRFDELIQDDRQTTAYDKLIDLQEKNHFAFCELAMRCRDPKHHYHRNAEKLLQRYGFVEADGTIKADIKKMALLAVTGDGYDMQLKEPHEFIVFSQDADDDLKMHPPNLSASTAEEVSVICIFINLKSLLDQFPFAFSELILKCRDPGYQYVQDVENLLRLYNLVEADGTISETVRNIVLSVVPKSQDWDQIAWDRIAFVEPTVLDDPRVVMPAQELRAYYQMAGELKADIIKAAQEAGYHLRASEDSLELPSNQILANGGIALEMSFGFPIALWTPGGKLLIGSEKWVAGNRNELLVLLRERFGIEELSVQDLENHPVFHPVYRVARTAGGRVLPKVIFQVQADNVRP